MVYPAISSIEELIFSFFFVSDLFTYQIDLCVFWAFNISSISILLPSFFLYSFSDAANAGYQNWSKAHNMSQGTCVANTN